MVKLFLVCFAVCMGATSGKVKVGTCTGQVKDTKELSEFSGLTYTMCYTKEETYKELKITVAQKPILKIQLVFGIFSKTSSEIKAILKIFFKDNSKPLEIDDITFTSKGSFSNFKLGDFESGDFHNEKCSDGKVLNELCNKASRNAGSILQSQWVEGTKDCGKAEACSKSTGWVKAGD